MVANDRRGSGAAGHFRGNFGGNFRWAVGVTPGRSPLLMQKLAPKRYANPSDSNSRVLIRFRNLHYRINLSSRRGGTEGIAISVVADNDIYLGVGLAWDQAI